MRYAAGAALVALLALTTPDSAFAQTEFQFAGVWSGSFEDQSRPQRDPATRGNTGVAFGLSEGSGRDRMIAGLDRYECDGDLRLEFRGPNDNLRGQGEIDQECRAARSGIWRMPTETLVFDDDEFEYEDEGEGEEKKLKFSFDLRARTLPSNISDPIFDSNELIECEADGAYKPDDEIFEGRYTCRQPIRQAQAGRRTMAMNIRGDFELRRGDQEGG